MLLAIDPGADSGWAVFNHLGRLTACGLGHDSLGDWQHRRFDDVVIECEQIRGRSEKNPNSILLMARNAGEWFGRFADVARYIRVADWKGTTPKDISHRRIWSRLEPEEIRALVSGCCRLSPRSAPIDEAVRAGLTKADKRANVLDAIGIGLWGVGR